MISEAPAYVRWFEAIGMNDLPVVGGKNASLGEMVRQLKAAGVRVPDGFAVTAEGYRAFVDANDLAEPITQWLEREQAGDATLNEAGAAIRKLIRGGDFPEPLTQAILHAYRELGERVGEADVDVAVRSSATAEDLPEASFAGQLESFLHVSGEEAVRCTCRECFASLFTDRAISYRQQNGLASEQVAISVGVQKMVRSDVGSAGVMFTLDTESGFPRLIVIDSAWGLGEGVVKAFLQSAEPAA